MITDLKECAFRGKLTFLVGREFVAELAKVMTGDVVDFNGLKVSRLPNAPSQFLNWSGCREAYMGSAVLGVVPYHDIYGYQGPPIESLQSLSFRFPDAEFYLTVWCHWLSYGPVRGRFLILAGRVLLGSYEKLFHELLMDGINASSSNEEKMDWINEYDNTHQDWVTATRSAAILAGAGT